MELKKLMSLDPQERVELEAKARQGDKEAVRDFVLLAAWKRISEDRMIPFKKKPKVLAVLADSLDVSVEFLRSA